MAEENKKKLVSADAAAKAVKKTVTKAGEKAGTAASAVKKTAAAAKDATAEKTKKTIKAAGEAAEKAKDAVEETVETAEEPKKAAAKKPAGEEEPKLQQAKPKGSSVGYRIGAIVLWVAALALEIVAILILNGTIKINLFHMTSLTQIIIFLVLDLICVVIGSQLWKKANHISPMSKKNKTLFWIWNNMGVIVAVACFLPFVILALSNKNTDKKTKVIATIVAIIAMLIAGVASYDWNPVSKEDLQQAEATLGDTEVYWAPFGKVYHTHTDCQALNHTDTLTYGTVDQAIAANRTRICSFCAKRDAIEGLPTDEKNVGEVVPDDVSPDSVDLQAAD